MITLHKTQIKTTTRLLRKMQLMVITSHVRVFILLSQTTTMRQMEDKCTLMHTENQLK